MISEPQKEHAWLEKLVGQWETSMECKMGPDQPPMQSKGRETVRSIGGLWVVGEGSSEAPGCGPMTTIITIGYDSAKKAYVGTFIASMMSYMWVYNGEMDANGKTLHLFAEGPNCLGGSGMTKFRDSIELIDDDHRQMKSAMLNEKGDWQHFMTSDYHRVK